MSNKNPYQAQPGYSNNLVPTPITGYGLAISSLNYWLTNHQLSIYPQKPYRNLMLTLIPQRCIIYYSPSINFMAPPSIVCSQLNIQKQLQQSILNTWSIPPKLRPALQQFIQQACGPIKYLKS